MIKKILKRLINLLLIGLILILFSVGTINIWVINSTKGKIYTKENKIPGYPVALVLGTSKKIASGNKNPYFYYRIKAAAELYHSKKVKQILVSGDNRYQYYNEPQDMKNALIKLGVPDSVITLDYAGLRTLDSVIRAKQIFGQDKMIIVTQKFHCYRALFISNFHNIDAIAYAAHNLPQKYTYSMLLREIIARTKAVIDLYILNKKPYHLGKKEKLKSSL